ncbi:uncharacterized protein LOC134534766 [Bacillus rossius redtenbacheri]|uniref:uncharacterized protein LOC134534766 n=1 Tax=Bacillus rossius redtenbacheri TaxID=93214 RepID=UPI002FDDF008
MHVSTEKCAKKPLVRDINSVLICHLCRGYLIDATTTDKCMHLFCRSCILAHLKRWTTCPLCGLIVNRLKRDKTYQTLVYKLIPGLYDNEVMRRIEFVKNIQSSKEIKRVMSVVEPIDEFVYSSQDLITIMLTFFDGNSCCAEESYCRYLECPTVFTVRHLKAFIRKKYGLCHYHPVVISCNNLTFTDSTTLLDIAYICAWNQIMPLNLHFKLLKCLPGYVSSSNFGASDELKCVKSHQNRIWAVEPSLSYSDVPCEPSSSQVQNDLQDCKSSMPVTVTKATNNCIEEYVIFKNNSLKCSTNSMKNKYDVGSFSSLASVEVTDICKMMLHVDLKEKQSEEIQPESRKENDESSSTMVNIGVNITGADKQKQKIKRSAENSCERCIKIVRKNFLNEKCNHNVNTSDVSGTQVTFENHQDYTHIPCSTSTCSSAIIINTSAVRCEDGMNSSCTDKSRNSLPTNVLKEHDKTDITDEQDELHSNITAEFSSESVNNLLLVDEANDVPSQSSSKKHLLSAYCFDNTRDRINTDNGEAVNSGNEGRNQQYNESIKCMLPASCIDTGERLNSDTDGANKEYSDSGTVGRVFAEAEVKPVEGVLTNPEDAQSELLPHVASPEESNTVKNVLIEGNDAEELVTKSKEIKQMLSVPNCDDIACIHSTVPVISSDVPEKWTTETSQAATDLVAANVDLVVKQVVEEMLAKQESWDSMTRCVVPESNNCCSANAECNLDLHNSNMSSEAKVTSQTLGLECRKDALSFCRENTSHKKFFQRNADSVCIGLDDNALDIYGCKNDTNVLPTTNCEVSGLISTKETKNLFNENKDYDNKPVQEVVNAVLRRREDTYNLALIDCKVAYSGLPDLEIIRKVDKKLIPFGKKNEDGFILCSNSNKNMVENKDCIKLNKMTYSFPSFTMKQDDSIFKQRPMLQDFCNKDSDSEHFLLEETKPSANDLMLDISGKDSHSWLDKGKCFTKTLVKPLLESKATFPDLLGGKYSLEANSAGIIGHLSGSEEKDEQVCAEESHDSALSEGLVTERRNEGKLVPLHCDQDDWNSTELGSTSQGQLSSFVGNQSTEMSSQNFINPNATQNISCVSTSELQDLKICRAGSYKNLIVDDKSGDKNGENTKGKLMLQPRIVLHKIKRNSCGSPPPRKIKVKLGKADCQPEGLIDSTDDESDRNDRLCASSKGKEIASGGMLTTNNIQPQELYPKSRRNMLHVTFLHQKKHKCFVNAQKSPCCNVPSVFKQKKNNETECTDDPKDDQCINEDQNCISSKLHYQVENCHVRKRKVANTEVGNAAICQFGLKERIIKCARSLSNCTDFGKAPGTVSLNVRCSSERNRNDEKCLVGRDCEGDGSPSTTKPGPRVGDRDDSGGGRSGPRAAGTKDVRVVVERCDGKLRKLAACSSPAIESKDNTRRNDDHFAKYDHNIASKLPNYCVMLTRLHPSAYRNTKMFSGSESSETLVDRPATLLTDSSSLGHEMTQPVIAKPTLSVTVSSAGSSQRTCTKNTNSSKRVCSEVKRKITTLAEEELSQDFEMNLMFR